METLELLARRFEADRPRLRAVAYRMLGSRTEAEDAVQEGWLRLSRADFAAVDNLGGWLTTVVSRICLDMLRARGSRREDSLDARLPDPVISDETAADPERAALRSDEVGLALLVVLDTLTPAERVAFVLHDMFAVPFEEIGAIVAKSPQAARTMASRARRRVRSAVPTADPDPVRRRTVVEAFHAAARDGRFADLMALLDPDVVLRVDRAEGLSVLRGAAAVAAQAQTFAAVARQARPVVVNGSPGVVTELGGGAWSVAAFTVAGGRIVRIDIIADTDRLAALGY